MATKSKILLRGGVVLTHGDNDQVTPLKADLLVEGNTIAAIEPHIEASESTTVIDCTDKVLSPGFIDTHHHVWQSLLKGRHANETLLEYMVSGNLQSSNHAAEDIFWGELGGVLECLDAGTTTVVDHAHLTYSPEHVNAAIAATVSSGIRSVFCFTPTARVDKWEPFAMSQDFLPSWLMETLAELAEKGPFGNGRVELGFGFDYLFLPKEYMIGIFQQVKALGVKLISIHYGRSAMFGHNSAPAMLESYGLLDSSIILAHATNPLETDYPIIKAANAHISSTPSTELQMALGSPVAFSLPSQSSLGIDCHSATTCFIPNEMRLLLQSARGTSNEAFLAAEKHPKHLTTSVQDVFNFGTIGGARACGMEDRIGSLAVGKRADIAVFDALSPSMVAAAQHDPVAAIVLHSGVRDVVMTIVDGVVRKSEGSLATVTVSDEDVKWTGGKKELLKWNDVAKEIVRRRVVLQEKIDKLDFEAGKAGILQAFYVSPDTVVDSV